jgi:hypothetical protein
VKARGGLALYMSHSANRHIGIVGS